MRRPIIAGNWKMNKTASQAQELINGLKQELSNTQDVDIVVCPTFTALAAVNGVIQNSNIQLGAQNVYWEDSGAFTGEISCAMLKELGVAYVIVGHSERRSFFGATNETVNKKVKKLLQEELTPIMCIGERLEQRESGQTFAVIEDHVRGGLNGLSADEVKKLIIAYEPVWAIGTGKTATPEQAQEAHNFIRQLLKKMYDQQVAEVVRIQYGGSVKPDNISELMAKADVDGALVGGASLKVDSFAKIVKGAA
ncbi:triose-phosphate isomerase [Candidatus Omnitrophota bacterium]